MTFAATSDDFGVCWELSERQRRFLQQTVLRPKCGPVWATPNQIILQRPGCLLREFSGATRPAFKSQLPILVVPPEVNQSFVVDFTKEQSFVGTLLNSGFSRVAAIDWPSATEETKNRDLDDSIRDILECIKALGGRVHLVGLCQGGYESAIAVALNPKAAATLTLVAAPIDFSAGHGFIKYIAWAWPMAIYEALVSMGGGVLRGDLISSGFDNLLPFERHFLKYLAIWNNLDDPEWMERFHLLNDWYRCPKDLAGPMYLRVVRELFKENRLVRGQFESLGERVNLKRIDCPLALVVGNKDHITPPAQVWAAKAAVSSEEVLEVETTGGHIGAFMGSEELNKSWPGIIDWLLDKEQHENTE